MDIKTCFLFRQVNRPARWIMSTYAPYHEVATHGLESLRAMLRTGLARYFTMTRLYRALCTEKCEVCDLRFGGFVFLLTATRCCFACLCTAPELRVMLLKDAKDHTRLGGVIHRRMAVLRCIQGSYGLRGSEVGRVQVVSAGALLNLAELDVEGRTRVENHRPRLLFRFAASTTLPLLDPMAVQGVVQHGLRCEGCRVSNQYPRRSSSNFYIDDRYVPLRPVYSRADYMAHFDTCTAARRLWRDITTGNNAPGD